MNDIALATPLLRDGIACAGEDELFRRIRTWTDRQPQKLLFCFLDERGEETERHTYASFLRRVEIIASHLATHPRLKTGDRVLLAYPPGLEMICALFACVR